MKQIEQYLKDNNFTAIESLKGGYCLDGKGGILYARLLNAMEEMLKDAYNEAIKDILDLEYKGKLTNNNILKLKK